MIDVVVELWYDQAWQDISTTVARREFITVRRGRRNWSSTITTSDCQLLINNDDLRYTPRNPLSPLYGKVVRSTPLRVTVEGKLRFLGEIDEIQPETDRSGRDRKVRVRAYGPLHRLRKGQTTRSAARLSLETFDPPPDAYWPLEEGEHSLVGRSAILGQGGMVLRVFPGVPAGGARIQYAADDGPPGAVQAPSLEIGAVIGRAPLAPTGDQSWTVTAAFKMRFGPLENPLVARTAESPNGTRITVGIFSPADDDSNLLVGMAINDGGTSTIMTHRFLPGTFEDTWHHYAITAVQSGGDIFFGFWVDGVLVDDHVTASTQLGALSLIESGTLDTPIALSHPAGWHSDRTSDIPAIAAAVFGYPGETAGRRIERIALEEQIPIGVVGALDDTQRMGPQASASALDIMQDAAASTVGVLYEPMPATRALGQFESGTADGWTGGGSPPPDVAVTTDQVFTGEHSLEITWGGGSGLQLIQRVSPQSIFVPGMAYTFTVWAYIPSGMPRVVPVVAGVTTGTVSTLTDAWELLSVSWVATGIEHSMQVWAADPTTSGDIAYVDDLIVTADTPAIGFRTLASVYSQAPKLVLDGLTELTTEFRPVSDDQHIRNIVTAKRAGGSEVTVVADDPQTDGPLNALPPGLGGVGRYADSVDTSVETDRRTRHRAGWELHKGTWDEDRYAGIGVNLARHPHLITAATSIDILDRIQVDPLPTVLPPGVEVDQIAHGITESITNRQWSIHYDTTPYGPHRIPVVADGPGAEVRFDSDYSTLADDIDATQTQFNIRTEPNRAVWVTDSVHSDEFPFAIRFGGERSIVSAIEGSGSDHRPASDSNSVSSTSHVAPSVTPVRDNAVLICCWCSFSATGSYTVPASMTEQGQTSGTFSTMADATEVVPASATGTRTATFSVSDAWSATSDSYDAVAGVTIQERLSGIATGSDDVTLVTSAATLAGWFLIAIHAWDDDSSGLMAAPTPGTWFSLNDTGGPTSTVSRIRVWTRQADIDGAQTVVFDGSGAEDNHARLYVVSGQFDQVFTVTRSENGVVKPHDKGTKITLDKRYYVGL